ncbi:ParB N-terminal domain-containing protein [Phytoactinopolyspora mesophila]|uniref:ParB-like N-terminal domain-containing protein n=1 Tax=Phytoactinopolyspora mesophila TaxID=2650750 RepID=A0A7K3M1Q8_9ACTN|nr:ParB N-terminal domain-containing protein [Phytoactinopolyspora mesophila]NDL57236.1 hypothetical protein [Phytoactinopolyspora mesophila]
MSEECGRIELDRAVNSIRVGHRHRHEMGDLDGLAASISQRGLLQPITISPDGVLVCGARRLAAVKQLGWRRVNVWVRSGISSKLEELLAEQDENMMRKPLTPTEAATLYQELKAILADDAARRRRATQFGARTQRSSSSGPATVAAPSGDARVLAAHTITGRKSYTSLERISEMQRIAEDTALPPSVRAYAKAEIKALDSDRNVARHFAATKAAVGTARAVQLTSPVRTPPAPRRHRLRAFRLLLNDVSDWTTHYDPGEIGRGLTDDEWVNFEAVVAATVAFAERARKARTAAAGSQK